MVIIMRGCANNYFCGSRAYNYYEGQKHIMRNADFDYEGNFQAET